MSLRNILAVAIAAALPSVAAAQSADASNATELDTVVVTGTRTALTVDDSLAAVEVIDRDDIERSQARSLPELLRGRAGVNLVNQGGAGKLTTLFLRGTESDHVLFLVDGVRVGSSTSGLASLQDLPLDLIERVEIVRGPRSSLYGSDAIGGVIQVFTRRTQDGVRPHLRLGAGSDHLREVGAGVDFGFDRAWLGVDYSYQATDEFQSCSGAGFPVFAGCFMDAPDPDRDGYERNAVSLRAGMKPVDSLTLEAHALRNEGRNEFDADPMFGLGDVSDTVQQVVGGKLRWEAGAATVSLSGGRNLDNSLQSRDGAFTDWFESTRDSASLQADVRVAEGQLFTGGFDWQRDAGEVRDLFSSYRARRRNDAVFAQYQGRFGRHDLQASARHDDNEQFGGHTTGSLAWGMSLPYALRLTASAGTAFKAPTFNELYFPFFGNPDLLPERSRSYELGLGQRREHWHWQANAFQTDVDDLIVYDPTIFIANNLDEARIRGAELTAGAQLAGWDVNASASWVDPRNRSAGANFDRLLPRRARMSGRIDVDRAIGDFRIGASLVGDGRRYDDAANQLALGGYATVDLRVEYALAPSWTLQARAANVFDRDYETSAFYAQAGRQYAVTLRYRPR